MRSFYLLLVVVFGSVHCNAVRAQDGCTLSTVIDWAKEPVKFQQKQLREGRPEAAELPVVNRPQTLFVRGNGDIYVPDPVNRRVLIFRRDGRFLRKIILDRKPTRDKPNPYMIPIIKVDASGNVYVANEAENEVEIYSRHGVLKTRFNYPGEYVWYMDVGRDGLIYLFGVDHRTPFEVRDSKGKRRLGEQANYNAKDMQSYSPYDVEPLEKGGWTTFRLRRDGHIVADCRTKLAVSDNAKTFVSKNGEVYFFKFNTDFAKDMNIVRITFTGKREGQD